MGFTGNATMKVVGDNLVRLTGLSLLHGASGSISLSGGTGDVKLAHAFQPKEYKNADGQDVSLQDSIQVIAVVGGGAVATSVPIKIVKTGTMPTDFLATLTNNSAGTDSAPLEIYVRFH